MQSEHIRAPRSKKSFRK